jgi:hypothetical protein
VLDRAVGNTLRWEHRGRLIRLRSRTWFLDRPRELPLRLVRHWKEAADRRGALPLDELMAGAALPDAQLETIGMVAVQAALSPTLFDLATSRHALRLYRALSPAQRQALGQGGTLPLGRMTPAQQRLFLEGLTHRRQARHPSLAGGAIDPAAAALSMTRTEMMRTILRQDNGLRYQDEAVTAGAGAAPADPAAPADGIAQPSRFRVSVLQFQLRYAANGTESFRVTAAP